MNCPYLKPRYAVVEGSLALYEARCSNSMQPSKLTHWVFWSFIFLYPFFKFFFHHQYPLTTWEFLLPCFFFILIFGLLALFLKNGAVDIIYLVLFYFLLSFVFGNLAWGEFVGMAFLFFGLFVCLKEANLSFSHMAGVFIAGILLVDVVLIVLNKTHQAPMQQGSQDVSFNVTSFTEINCAPNGFSQ